MYQNIPDLLHSQTHVFPEMTAWLLLWFWFLTSFRHCAFFLPHIFHNNEKEKKKKHEVKFMTLNMINARLHTSDIVSYTISNPFLFLKLIKMFIMIH